MHPQQDKSKRKGQTKDFKKGSGINEITQPCFGCVIFFAIRDSLFLLMPVLPQTLFALVC